MTAQPTFDTTPIDDLLEIGGLELVQEIAEVFLDGTPGLLADIATAVANEDWELLVRASHSLKSSAFYLGAMHLSAVSADIEREAQAKQLATCKDLSEQAPQLFEQAKSALHTYQNNLPPQP